MLPACIGSAQLPRCRGAVAPTAKPSVGSGAFDRRTCSDALCLAGLTADSRPHGRWVALAGLEAKQLCKFREHLAAETAAICEFCQILIDYWHEFGLVRLDTIDDCP